MCNIVTLYILVQSLQSKSITGDNKSIHGYAGWLPSTSSICPAENSRTPINEGQQIYKEKRALA